MYELKENESCVIVALHFESAFQKRLRDMGFCEGEAVQCVKIAAAKSPVLYRVKGSLVALRKTDAMKIEVAYA